MRVDLHCHTTISDGALTPTELVQRAALYRVQLLAITDHDSSAAWEEANQANQTLATPLTLVTGIEFSCQWRHREIHILGFDFDRDHAAFAAFAALEAQQSQVRAVRAATMAERLVKKGVPDALEAVTRIARGSQIGRPHFAQLLVERGMAETHDGAFRKYLRRGKSLYVAPQWCTIADAVAAIVNAGGVAAIAHPIAYELSNMQLNELIETFIAAGGQALEVASGHHNPGDVQKLARLAEKYQLLGAAGSDFHRPGGWQELGKNTQLPEPIAPVWHSFSGVTDAVAIEEKQV